MKIITGNYAGFDCCVQTCTHIFKSSASERLKSPQRFVRSPFAKFAQVSEFCDHNFSKTQLHKAPVVHISLNLFWSLTIIITNLRLPERRSRWYLNFSFQQELKDHSRFFSSRAKKVIHEMPPSHFVDLRLVKTNLDKEGLKFQLEEHAVARILEVWGSCAKTQQRKVLTSGNFAQFDENFLQVTLTKSTKKLPLYVKFVMLIILKSKVGHKGSFFAVYTSCFLPQN